MGSNDYQSPGDWHQNAACKGAGDTFELPFARPGKANPKTVRRINLAKQICAICPVKHDCYQWAMTVPDPAYCMIAAGLTPPERDAIRGRRHRTERAG